MSDERITTQPRGARRRSVHFVPGGNEKFLARALASEADTLVLDLEDSIPPDHKVRARAAVSRWVEDVETDKELMVRLNSLDTPWWHDDVVALGPLRPHSVMVPKVTGAADLGRLEAALLEVCSDSTTSFFPVATETAEAVFAIADMARHPRTDGLCWGAEDLSAAIGAHTARDADGQLLPVFQTVQSLCLIGAAVGGVGAVDAVWTDLGDREGLRRESELAAAMGFVGKVTIHPDQIEVVNAAFTPSRQLIEEAEELLAAFEEHERSGAGAFRHRGQMVDAPHIDRARRIVARGAELHEELPGTGP